jgi:hypothetical protein
MKPFTLCALLVLFTVSLPAFGFTEAGKTKLDLLATAAVSTKKSAATAAIAELRKNGQPGLDALAAKHALQIAAFKQTGKKTPEWQRIAIALDAVAMQKDSYAAQLYWFTDLELAKAEAAKSGKPILSLRLLGNLTEELSCANSRFFRAVLYPNTAISGQLRENFILHWKSVRPAPKVTVDFGDGRKIETTITGNSIHYVLDGQGNVLDAIPGLYGPEAFRQILTSAQEEAATAIFLKNNPKARKQNLTRYHQTRLQTIQENWGSDLQLAKVALTRPAGETAELAAPTAITASFRAMAKAAAETRLLPVVTLQNRIALLETDTDLPKWAEIAKLRRKEAKIDAAGAAFISRKTGAKNAREIIAKFEENLALDTVRNEYLFHSKLYAMLAQGEAADLEKFNDKVYAQLFLTPSSDPWLGLMAPDVFTGIEGGGVTGNDD